MNARPWPVRPLKSTLALGWLNLKCGSTGLADGWTDRWSPRTRTLLSASLSASIQTGESDRDLPLPIINTFKMSGFFALSDQITLVTLGDMIELLSKRSQGLF